MPILAVPLAWMVLSALFAYRAWDRSFLALFNDTDDATRLVVVRDLMGGQNWFDHVEHRFNTPFGAEIHWSRLIDLPLSWLISGFEPLAPGLGERIALFVWPMLWLLPALWLAVVLTRRLLGPGHEIVALVLATLALPVFSEFAPGRIDHHNVQAVLILWLAIECLGALRTSGGAWRAGIAAATSLAIGAETLPVIAAAVIAFGLNWVIDEGFAPRLWRFGLAFAGAMLAHFLIAIGPDAWFITRCDALSNLYLTAAVGIALVFVGLVQLPISAKAWAVRLAAGASAGLALLAVLLAFFPSCAAGPFAGLDPWLRAAWLTRIGEAEPLSRAFATQTNFAIAATLPVLLGLVAALGGLAALRGSERLRYLTYLLLLAGAMAGLVLQMRGIRLAGLVAVPGTAAFIAYLRGRYLAAAGALRLPAALILIAGWIASGGLTAFFAASMILPSQTAARPRAPFAQCLEPAAFTALTSLTPARIAAPVDLGPYLLLMTPHAVIGSPYHRNGEGIGDTYRIFGGAPDAARAILDRRGIDLVVTCTSLTPLTGGDLDAPDSLKKQFEAGTHPDWLSPVAAPDGPLSVYRVAR